MKTTLKLLTTLSAVLVLSCTKTAENSNGTGGSPNGSCWCTEGMAHKFGIIHYRDARYWDESTLAPAGSFVRKYSPLENDIAVFDANYHCSSAGHVTMVKKIVPFTGGYTITFWGTNQGPDQSRWNIECGCDNFSEWTFKVYDDEIANSRIRFYRNTAPVIHCGTLFPIASGGGGSGGTKIISIPPSLNFGNVNTGQTAQINMNISSTGTGSLNVSSVSVPTGYSCNYSGQIAAGQSANAAISFSPSSGQVYSGTITVNSDATSGNNTATITGTGTTTTAQTRIISLGGNLSYGNVQLFQTSTRTITISNNGNSPLNVSSINLPLGFSGNWSGTIQPGTSISTNISFTPSSVQSYSGNLTVNSNATSGTNTIAVSGTGVSSGGGGGPTSNPLIGTYANCAPSGFYNCGGGTLYEQGLITARIVSINTVTHQLVIEIKKCSGTTFNNGGNVIIVSGLCSGVSYSFGSFSGGSSSILVNVQDNNMTGTKTYYPFIIQGPSLNLLSSTPALTVTY